MNKKFQEAVDHYTKAIEISTPETEGQHIFYSNRAMSLIKLERYADALEDAKKAIEIDPKYVKAYIRKAEAERELRMNEEALQTLQQGLDLEEENKQLTELYEEHKKEWDDDHTVDESDPMKQRFNKLESWLQGGGSNYEKLKIRFYTPIYRGVHAAKDIRAGE